MKNCSIFGVIVEYLVNIYCICSVVVAILFEERRNNKRYLYGLCKDVVGYFVILISLFFKIFLKSRVFDVEDVGFFGCYVVIISM